MAYKGKYQPSFPRKYKGDPTNIVFRSLWERKFMVYCDKNANVLEWASEEIAIPYVSPVDQKPHRYFPDFYMKVKETGGAIKKYVIEVKPLKQCSPPKKPKRQTKGYIREAFEYAKNQAKWKEAREWCADRQWEFKVVTEKELGIK
tara:strand:+ start:10327 stop:10764 length:438 start_codon:yes stop_codon:yes gene_type:complete